MSAQPQRKQPAPENGGRPNGRIKTLMLEMGVPGGQFTAIPPDQWKWMEPEAAHNFPLNRMWSAMIHRTCGWGHESPYATNSDGTALTLEQLAELLGMDPSQANKTWQLGKRLGIFRNGTPQEGKRRLYLCGKVEPQEDTPKEGDQFVVCTDHKLPPYLEKIVAGWPADRAGIFRAGWRRHVATGNRLEANFMAAARYARSEFDDSFLKGWGLEKNRLNREEFSIDETLAKMAKAHLETIAPVVAREVRLDELTEEAWKAMPEAERAARLKAAGEELVAEYRAGTLNTRGWGKKRWESETEAHARRQIRQKLAAGPVDNCGPELSVHTTNDSVQSANGAPYGTQNGQGTAAHPYTQHPSEKGQKSEPSRKTRTAGSGANLQPLPPDEHKQLHTPPPPDSYSAADVRTVSDALFHAWGSPLEPEDESPKKLLEIGLKHVGPKLAAAVVERWVFDFAASKASSNYVIESPRLFVAAAERGALAAWIRGNGKALEALVHDQHREEFERRNQACQQLFEQMPSFEKLLPGGPVISFDQPEHIDGVFAIVDELRGADVLAFAIFATAKLRGPLSSRGALKKLPGRPEKAPAGPRLLSVLFELAREYRVELARKGGKR